MTEALKYIIPMALLATASIWLSGYLLDKHHSSINPQQMEIAR